MRASNKKGREAAGNTEWYALPSTGIIRIRFKGFETGQPHLSSCELPQRVYGGQRAAGLSKMYGNSIASTLSMSFCR